MPMDPRLGLRMLAAVPTIAHGLWRYRQIGRRIQRRFGVPSPAPLDFFGNPGAVTLVYTSRLFQPGADLLDDSFKFVGPMMAPRADALDFPFDWLDRGPVLYISLGTLFNERPDFFRACIAAFGQTAYRVVMSIGRKIDVAALGPLPANILARPFVPQLDILKRADLFITHGGMNSVNESAWYGVPMLVVPQVGDQLFVARRVQQLGAGLALDPHRFTPQSLRLAAERVVDDSTFKRQSVRLGASLRAAGGAARAADEILHYVRVG